MSRYDVTRCPLAAVQVAVNVLPFSCAFVQL
jgi:hypothetical protein